MARGDNNPWDDSALIQAFDSAMRKYKNMHGLPSTAEQEARPFASQEAAAGEQGYEASDPPQAEAAGEAAQAVHGREDVPAAAAAAAAATTTMAEGQSDAAAPQVTRIGRAVRDGGSAARGAEGAPAASGTYLGGAAQGMQQPHGAVLSPAEQAQSGWGSWSTPMAGQASVQAQRHPWVGAASTWSPAGEAQQQAAAHLPSPGLSAPGWEQPGEACGPRHIASASCWYPYPYTCSPPYIPWAPSCPYSFSPMASWHYWAHAYGHAWPPCAHHGGHWWQGHPPLCHAACLQAQSCRRHPPGAEQPGNSYAWPMATATSPHCCQNLGGGGMPTSYPQWGHAWRGTCNHSTSPLPPVQASWAAPAEGVRGFQGGGGQGPHHAPGLEATAEGETLPDTPRGLEGRGQ